MSDKPDVMDFEGGKYTVVSRRGNLQALRYGEPWRDLTGDNLVGAMLYRALELEAELTRVQQIAADQSDALHRIDLAVIGHLPTFELKHTGGTDAAVRNLVEAIEKAGKQLEESKHEQR